MPTAQAFPSWDPVGPAVQPLPPAAMTVLADVVAPAASETDDHGVPRSHLDALAGAGLHGSPLAGDQQRELSELLAGADATTWFCWVQHQSPMRILEDARDSALAPWAEQLRAQLLPGMRDGSILNAVAFAHVRRPGPPNPVATRVAGGWSLTGTLDWVTSWDIADVVMVMAQGDGDHAGEFICAYLPAGRSGLDRTQAGLDVGEPLRLLAMSGTHTRPLRLEGFFVPDELVGDVLDRQAWLSVDAQRTADPNPAAFGVARGAIAELASLAESRSDENMAQLAEALIAECRSLRSASYAAIDSPDREGTRAARLQLRARSLDLAARAAQSVVIARAGASMLGSASSGRRMREALFLLVQAQTADTRAASLQRMAQAVSGREWESSPGSTPA